MSEEKYHVQYQMLYQWVRLKQHGIRLGSFFNEHNMRNIAIYGIGEIALVLYDELRNDNTINLVCGIDMETRKRCGEIKVVSLEELAKFNDIDVVVVTPVSEYGNIERNVKKYYKGKIISLDDVVFGCRL